MNTAYWWNYTNLNYHLHIIILRWLYAKLVQAGFQQYAYWTLSLEIVHTVFLQRRIFQFSKSTLFPQHLSLPKLHTQVKTTPACIRSKWSRFPIIRFTKLFYVVSLRFLFFFNFFIFQPLTFVFFCIVYILLWFVWRRCDARRNWMCHFCCNSIFLLSVLGEEEIDLLNCHMALIRLNKHRYIADHLWYQLSR